MAQPLNPWPGPPEPVEPSELPPSIFYAIVCDDEGTAMKAKAYRRRSFTSYIELTLLGTTIGYRSGDTPTLYTSKKEAELNRQSALDFFNIRTSKTTQLRLQVFRIVESEWHTNIYDDAICAFRDARRIASGVLHYSTVAEQIKKLAGKVLTVVDAAYVNENQNKAVKDLTKNCFRSQLSDLYKTAHEDPNSDGCEGMCVKDTLDD